MSIAHFNVYKNPLMTSNDSMHFYIYKVISFSQVLQLSVRCYVAYLFYLFIYFIHVLEVTCMCHVSYSLL